MLPKSQGGPHPWRSFHLWGGDLSKRVSLQCQLSDIKRTRYRDVKMHSHKEVVLLFTSIFSSCETRLSIEVMSCRIQATFQSKQSKTNPWTWTQNIKIPLSRFSAAPEEIFDRVVDTVKIFFAFCLFAAGIFFAFRIRNCRFQTRDCFLYVRPGLCPLVICAKGDSPRVLAHGSGALTSFHDFTFRAVRLWLTHLRASQVFVPAWHAAYGCCSAALLSTNYFSAAANQTPFVIKICAPGNLWNRTLNRVRANSFASAWQLKSGSLIGS